MRTTALIREHATTSMILLALLCAGLVITLEAVVHLPVKMPGHRALPGALALLVMAETFGPLMLLALAAAVPTTLVLLGHCHPWAIAVWLVCAVLLAWTGRAPSGRRLIPCVLFGLLFGLLRYLSLVRGWHHAPELVRAAGHLCFGAGGGLLAFAVLRLSRRYSMEIPR
jgi:hypothetical protein